MTSQLTVTRERLQWFMHQINCDLEDFLANPKPERKERLDLLLIAYQEAVKEGQIELPNISRRH